MWWRCACPPRKWTFSPSWIVSRRAMESSPKALLNSLDYAMGDRARPSRKSRWRRLLARIYVSLAQQGGRGDTFRLVLTKP